MKRKVYLFFIIICLATFLTGCETKTTLKSPQIIELKKNINNNYSDSVTDVDVWYSGAGVFFRISLKTVNESEVYSMLSYINELFQDKSFVNKLFEDYSKDSVDKNDWNNGYRPDVRVWFQDQDGLDQYAFIAGYYNENYNSGYNPSDYTYDGYSTWYGEKRSDPDTAGEEITPEEIDDFINKAENHDSFTKSELLQKSTIIDVELNGDHNIISLVDDKVFYCDLSGIGTNEYFIYDIKRNETKHLGTLNNISISNRSQVFIDDHIFFYTAKVSDEYSGKSVLRMHDIDIANGSLSTIKSEYIFQTLPFVGQLNKNVYTVKGDFEGDIATSFIDKFDNANYENKRWLDKNFKFSDKNGEIIKHVAGSQDRIYVLIYKYNKGLYTPYIELYSSNGDIVDTININDLREDLAEEAIELFKVIGDYFYIRNFSGRAILFKMNGEKVLKLVEGEEHFVCPLTPFLEADEYGIFYESYTKDIYLLDTKTDSMFMLSNISADIYSILDIYTDNQFNALIKYRKSENNQTVFYKYINIFDYINETSEIKLNSSYYKLIN